MAEDKLVGNIDTQDILDVLESNGNSNLIDPLELAKAKQIAIEIFSRN